MNSKLGNIVLLVAILLFSACATTPKLNLEGVDKKLGPEKVLTSFASFEGDRVLWGGIIVSSQNLKDSSMLEILAYPLDDNYKPDLNVPALSRFIAVQDKYLETLVYAPGRSITMVAVVEEIKRGKIGEAEYNYPLVKAEQIYLWSNQKESSTRFHFGVGVMMHN